MTTHDLLLFIHLVAAMIWVGGMILLDVLNRRAAGAGDPQRVVGMASASEFVAKAIFNPAGIITLLAGFGLVLESDVWTFTMGWIVFAIAVVVASAILGMAFYGKQLRAVHRIAADRGAEDPEIGRRLARVRTVANTETLFLLAVVWMMVFKPGA
jgi:uncharacterized membrane protein